MTAGPVRVAVVGCGAIGRVHARAVVADSEAELVALVSQPLSSAEELADEVLQWSADRPRTYETLRQAFLETPVDLVTVTTPSGVHLEIAEQALSADKHIFVEKPIEVTLPRALQLLRAARRAEVHGVVAAAVSQHRFDRSSVAVKSAIERGEFGRLTSAVASIAWWRSQQYYDSADWRGTWDIDGGGAVMNQGVHTVDLLVWFMGRPVEVTAHTARLAHTGIEVEDVAVATIRFESGALAVVHATTAAYPGLTARIQVMGDKGSAVIDQDELSYFHTANKGEDVGDLGLDGRGNQRDALVGASANRAHADPTLSSQGHARQYRDVFEAIRDKRRPLLDVAEAVATLATVHAMYLSSTLKRPIRVQDVLDGNYADQHYFVRDGVAR